ncbi:MAG: GntR family transcriptional regulator [Acidimicrobiales bacterium]
MPLWAQLEADLQRRLELGEFDERFPTDGALVDEYDVSRHTVREAIRHLNRAGVLTRERGRGTVVNRAEFEQSLGALYSLFQSIEGSGVEQRSEVLQLTTQSDPEAAARLGVDGSTELVFLERLRWAGHEPLAIDRVWIPADIGAPLLGCDFTHTALYDELEKSCGFRPNQGWERLTPLVPSVDDRQRLGIKRGLAAFHLERLGSRDGQPVEWRTTLIRGDRYRFVADWSAGTASALVPQTTGFAESHGA